jgi:6-phosphogluconate dehydrogenase
MIATGTLNSYCLLHLRHSPFGLCRSARTSANLIQAQRDYFGAHTYERIDKPRHEMSHTNWTGRGGTTASSSYNA